MTEQSEHLSNAQIENYGNRTSGAGPETAQRDEPQRAEQRMADKLSDDQSAADQSMIDQPGNDQRMSDQDTSDQRIEAHLADCASCRNRLLDFHRSLFVSPINSPESDRTKANDSKNDPTDSALADSKFANPKYPVQTQVRTAPTPECPSDDALRQLAAGLSVDDTATAGNALATKLLQHAATCNHCGALLRTYTELFSDDFTPEEQAALASLQSASAEWQKSTARQMLEAGAATAAGASAAETGGSGAAATVKPDAKYAARPVSTAAVRKPFFWKWILIPTTSTIVAIVAFSFWYLQRDTPAKVEALLAQAYTEDRTTELRWPGAEYANIRQTLSGESGSVLSVPESLRNAANKIDLGLRKNPDDSKWLLLSARLHLIEGHYQPALTDLNKIDNEQAAGTSDYLTTRALALYEKGGSEPNGRQFYGEAVDLLGKVLQQNPDNPAALFNQALACEKVFAFDCAASDWQRLLEVEKNSNWAHEAQQHLIRIQEKKKLEH